jgi:HlyD family secretion protein
MKRKPPVAILVIIIVGAVVAIGFYFLVFRKTENPNQVALSGNIEVTTSQLGFKIPGRLLERLVNEGDSVTSGQTLAKLESRDQELAVAQAEANLALVQATLDELLAGSRPEDIARAAGLVDQSRARLNELANGSREQEIADALASVDRARAALDAAKSQLALAESDYNRYTSLYNEHVVTTREYDQVRTQYELAQSSVDQAQALLTSAEERLSLVQEGPRTEQIEQARAALEQAQAGYNLVLAGPRQETLRQARARVAIAQEQLNLVKQTLEYTQLSAPFDGVVLSKSAEPGEYLSPGAPVVTVGGLDHVYLRAFINETDLGRVQLGQAVQVTTDSYPGKIYEGTISYISDEAEFTPKSVQTSEERVKLVYLIKVELANPDHELKPGMPADCVIEVKP